MIDKIRIQWKTISKAFKDIGRSKDFILKPDLKFYLDHWGLQLDDSQVQDIFRMLDQDQDGKISFYDWTQSIGHEIHPGETLYFR